MGSFNRLRLRGKTAEMDLTEATYYVLSQLNQGVGTAEWRESVAEPEFRPFNLSVLRRSNVGVERTTNCSTEMECCGARQKRLPAYLSRFDRQCCAQIEAIGVKYAE